MMSGTGGDETYLEAFVESLSALPHDVKRSLELLKDLDARCGDGTAHLLRLQQQYLEEAEARMMELEVVLQPQQQPQPQPQLSSEATEQDGENGFLEIDPPTAASATYTAGLRVLGEGSKAVVIPTTLELEQYVHRELQGGSRPRYEEIADRQRDVLQLADEKVAVASQLYDRMDGTVRRLDRDLAEMEKLLQTSGDFASPSLAAAASSSASAASAAVVGKPNDLAACQVSPGSEWILAKVLQHDPTTGMYRLADEDVESNKVFNLPESQVVLCGVDKLSKGEAVFCVYPDTTSFYQATVVQAPRKNQANTGSGSFVMVNFVDDSDEFGVTHDKAVPLKHVIYPPYGATTK